MWSARRAWLSKIRPGFRGDRVQLNFHQGLVALDLIVERLLELRGWNVAEVAVKAGGVVPMDTTEGCELDVLNRFPWAAVGRTAE